MTRKRTSKAADKIGDERAQDQIRQSAQRVFGDPSVSVDQQARDAASDAMSKVESHEQLCTERWNSSRQASERVEAGLSDLKKAMDTRIANLQTSLDNRIGKLPASIISILMGLVGFLASRAFPFHG